MRVNEVALQEFLHTAYPRLVAAVALASGSRPAAEDAVQEALAPRLGALGEGRGDRVAATPGSRPSRSTSHGAGSGVSARSGGRAAAAEPGLDGGPGGRGRPGHRPGARALDSPPAPARGHRPPLLPAARHARGRRGAADAAREPSRARCSERARPWPTRSASTSPRRRTIMALDERLRRDLEHAARPADPTGVYEQLIRRRERRVVVRRLRAGGLAIVVVVGTIVAVSSGSRASSRPERAGSADVSGDLERLARDRARDRIPGHGHAADRAPQPLGAADPRVLTAGEAVAISSPSGPPTDRGWPSSRWCSTPVCPASGS